jgi:hypothetical protein
MKTQNSRAAALLGVALLIAPVMVLGASAPTGAGAATPTRVLTCTEHPATKPSTYVTSCADYGAGWTGVTWTTWNATSATGHGFLRQNDCTPDCAVGKFIKYRATIALSKVIASKKYGDLFTQAIVHYSVSGVKKSETFKLNDR